MSKFVMFLDESGNHDLNSVDNNFPVFCLSGCIFDRDYYHSFVRPRVDQLKIKYWNSNDVILHSREIRKCENDFYILNYKSIKKDFYNDLDKLIQDLDFSIISIVIDKNELKNKYNKYANDPYQLSLEFILERYSFFLSGNFATGFTLAESRGKHEDESLINLYKHFYSSGTRYNQIKNITSLTTKKKSENIIGLQIADLIAYPIATKVIRPNQENLAFDIIRGKILSKESHTENILGFGMKIFPIPDRCKGVFK